MYLYGYKFGYYRIQKIHIMILQCTSYAYFRFALEVAHFFIWLAVESEKCTACDRLCIAIVCKILQIPS